MTDEQKHYITHEQPVTMPAQQPDGDGYRVIMHERDAVLITPSGERIEANDASAMAWLADVLNDYDQIVTAACEAASRIEAYLRALTVGYSPQGELTAALAAINATGIRRHVGLPLAVLTDAQIAKLRQALFCGGDSTAAGVSPSPRPAVNCGGGAA